MGDLQILIGEIAGAHVVAQFDEESTYMACLPALEQLAASQGYIVTESVTYEEK